MRVIDGMHRLMAASSQGRDSIDVIFFDGSENDVFLHAVQENIAHGLPLSRADRRAAAERIISSHPHMSDRAIGRASGLAAKTVAAIRKRSGFQAIIREGEDGKLRALDSSEARVRAADLLTSRPNMTLREVAQECGISPATVLDVRKRLDRGESPMPTKPNAARSATGAAGPAPKADSPGTHRPSAPSVHPETTPKIRDPAEAVEKLLRDPSFRNNEQGKWILRLLHHNALGSTHLSGIAQIVPPHRVTSVMHLARHYAHMWHDLAEELERRSRVIDPPARTRLLPEPEIVGESSAPIQLRHCPRGGVHRRAGRPEGKLTTTRRKRGDADRVDVLTPMRPR